MVRGIIRAAISLCFWFGMCASRHFFFAVRVRSKEKWEQKKKYIFKQTKNTRRNGMKCVVLKSINYIFSDANLHKVAVNMRKKKKENKTKNSTAHCNWNRTSTQQLLRCFDVFFFSFIFLLEMKIYCTDSHSNSNLYSYFIRIFQNCLILTLKLLCAVARAQVRMFAIAFSIAANNVDANIGAIRCHTRAGQYPAKE